MYLEFKEPSHFSKYVVAYLKNWCLVSRESQTCSGTNFFGTTFTAEIYRNIIQQFIALCVRMSAMRFFNKIIGAYTRQKTQYVLFGAIFWGANFLVVATQPEFFWAFLCGVISRILSLRMLLEVLHSSRKKKLRMQLEESIPQCSGRYF